MPETHTPNLTPAFEGVNKCAKCRLARRRGTRVPGRASPRETSKAKFYQTLASSISPSIHAPCMRIALGPLLLALFSAACSATASAPPPPRSITIEATATLHLPPDMAAISLTFGALDDELAVAHATVERNRTAFLAAVADSDVRVERGLIQYSPYRPSHAAVERYQASDTVVIHTSRPADIPRIITLASEGLTAVSVRHYVSDLVQHRGQVRELAIAAARTKASELATGFDAELGRVLTVHEGGATQSAFGVGNVDNAFARVEADDEGVPPPGAIPLRLTLHVMYELEG